MRRTTVRAFLAIPVMALAVTLSLSPAAGLQRALADDAPGNAIEAPGDSRPKDDEPATPEGWREESGKRTYWRDGQMLTGIQTVDGVDYLFGEDGAMTTGWGIDPKTGSWCYADADGALRTGWLQKNGSWYLLGADHLMLTGWQQEGGSTYYLDGSGAMQTQWALVDGRGARGLHHAGEHGAGTHVAAGAHGGAAAQDGAHVDHGALPHHGADVDDGAHHDDGVVANLHLLADDGARLYAGVDVKLGEHGHASVAAVVLHHEVLHGVAGGRKDRPQLGPVRKDDLLAAAQAKDVLGVREVELDALSDPHVGLDRRLVGGRGNVVEDLLCVHPSLLGWSSVKHELVEGVEAGDGPDHQALGAGHGAVDEDLAARGSVREADLLVRAKEVHLMGAGDGAAAQGVHADLARRPHAHHALATVGDGRLAGRVDGLQQQLGRAGGGVGLLVVVGLHDLDVPVAKGACRLGAHATQHGHAQRVVGRVDHARGLAQRPQLAKLGIREARCAAEQRGPGAAHVGQHVRQRRLIGEVNGEVGRGGRPVELRSVGGVVGAQKLEAPDLLQARSDERAHAPPADQHDASQ